MSQTEPKFYIQVRFYDDGEPPSEWETLPRGYKSADGAYQAGVRLECANMANGASCATQVVDSAGVVVRK